MRNEGFAVAVAVGVVLELWAGRPWRIASAADVASLPEAARLLAGAVHVPQVPPEVVERTWREWPHLRHAVEAVVRNAPRA